MLASPDTMELIRDGDARIATPLCVDLDGTLIFSDTLVEGLLSGLTHPQQLPRMLAGSRAALKRRVAEVAPVDPRTLPYNTGFLAFLKEQRAAGRYLVLATAADAQVAQAIAEHLDLFDEVIASDGQRNLKGEAKAAALVERFGEKGFAYAGNDRSDLPVWKAARSIIIVNASRSTREQARIGAEVEAEFGGRPAPLRSMIKAMRPHQWAKNVLVFVPMVTAHALGEAAAWTGALGMFVAFCVTASGIYILNDLSDLAADRRHPRKRLRPFASGALSPAVGVAMAAVLLALGIGLSAATGTFAIIAIYAIASVSYSVALKEFPLVDIFMLAGLYTVRVLGGGVASGHTASLWLLAFSGFLFLSLALVKRVEEMTAVARSSGNRTAARRGYFPGDIPILQTFGCASAFASAVVLALFVGSTAASAQYGSPELLWGIVPLILFWQCRLWLSTVRGHMHDDPIVYAAHDWVSWIVAGCVFALVLAADSNLAHIL
ncbi:UbiA family prenyltransferase [Plastoroseomonas hellenica]|uniref:UbiA family prenyltransferase n=1 Tax=Plastoroseomonas hellenica TaxID=2687306 RepID=UPI001BA669A1|nr:UbiA family prenyltransferase [Plastoroseomonas hellenica]MBR0645500.1 UbiA family prenyltransferase [Plastoroseomonas hellenica]